MVDIRLIRENPDFIKKSCESKNSQVDIDRILELDNEYKKLFQEVQNVRTERNSASKERDIERGREIKQRLDSLEQGLKKVEEELASLLFQVPNPPKEDVKTGASESDNEVIKTVGEIRQFNFKPLDHVELGEKLDIIDIERAAKVSGARFYYLKNEGALLEFALIRYALDMLMQKGFSVIIPPTIINFETMSLLGYMENGGQEDMFHIQSDNKILVGTAEQSIVPMHKGEVFDVKDLPKRYVGYSSSFRREAGSYGKDTRGILRVHEFHKVEMVSYVSEGKDDDEHNFLLELEEELIGGLGLPYQVVKMCSGDLGFPAARKYDVEVYIPTQEKYRELTSASTTTDFQARRLNIKYKDGDEKKYVNILNGTAFAIGRTLIAILENYQNEDLSITIPEVLKKYLPFVTINPK